MNGIARNTEAIREYLKACPAVESMAESDGNLITFKFDPAKQPENPPEGVFFNLSEAPF